MSLARQQYEWISSSAANAQLKSYAAAGIANLSRYPSSVGSSSFTASAKVAAAASTAAGGAPHIVGRLKVLEFYADW